MSCEHWCGTGCFCLSHSQKKVTICTVRWWWGLEEKHFSICKRLKKKLRKCIAHNTAIRISVTPPLALLDKVIGIKVITRQTLKKRQIRKETERRARQKELGL